MGINQNNWVRRNEDRSDLVLRITHLTRGKTDDEAFNNLWKILTDKVLIASGNDGFVNGNIKATCFQELPLSAIAENLRYEKSIGQENVRYSWFGIRINKGSFFQKNGRPVMYGKKEELMNLLEKKEEYWRIVSLDLTSSYDIVDWTHEREWRVPGNFSFEYEDIEVLVKNGDYYRKLINKCKEENREDILLGIHGIIPLNSIYK